MARIEHPDGAHSGQLIDRLEPLSDRLREQRGELLIVEYLEIASRGDFAHGRRMPSVPLIAIRTLHENGGIRGKTLGEDLAPDVIQPHAFPDVPPRLLHDGVPVHVGQQAQTETIGAARVRESVDGD